MSKKICTVLVTFNRKEYLLKELIALENQTVFVDEIIIVDNNSTDGTVELLIEKGYITGFVYDNVSINYKNNIKFIYYRSSKNTGGSGGFQKAFELALKEDCSYIWAMDDDVLPQSDCLENLLKGISNSVGVCVPNRNFNGYIDRAVLGFNWKNPFRPVAIKESLIVETNDLYVKDFAFEGPFFKKELIERIGIPNSDYFIFFDDSDFAQRCLKETNILYVVNARLEKQIIPNSNSSSKFNWRSYYICRNEIIFDRLYNKNKVVSTIRPYILLTQRMIKYTLKNDKIARKYALLAFKDAMNGNLGKVIEPGSF